MKKLVLLSLFTSSLLFSFDYEREGLEVKYTDSNDEEKSILIKRQKDNNCLKMPFNPKLVLGEDMASTKVPKNCKKTFVSSVGKISPIKFSDKIDTYGELEVLEFIEKAKNNKNMLLIDSRTTDWYIQQTIPSAVNVPYIYLKKSQYPDDFEEMIELIGVKKINDKYDFSNAKELLLFCNGLWCGQSPVSMKRLIKLGYPEEKLNWYRGGIQSWLSLNLPLKKSFLEALPFIIP